MGTKGSKKTKCERLPGLKRTTASKAAERLWRVSNKGVRIRRIVCSSCDRPWPDDCFERHQNTGRRFDLCPRCQWASRLNMAEKEARKMGLLLPHRATFQPDGLPHYNPFTAEVLPAGPGVYNESDRVDAPVETVELCGGPEIPFPGGVGAPVTLNESALGEIGIPKPGKIQAFVKSPKGAINVFPGLTGEFVDVPVSPDFDGKLTLAAVLTAAKWTADDLVDVIQAMRTMTAVDETLAEDANGKGDENESKD